MGPKSAFLAGSLPGQRVLEPALGRSSPIKYPGHFPSPSLKTKTLCTHKKYLKSSLVSEASSLLKLQVRWHLARTTAFQAQQVMVPTKQEYVGRRVTDVEEV